MLTQHGVLALVSSLSDLDLLRVEVLTFYFLIIYTSYSNQAFKLLAIRLAAVAPHLQDEDAQSAVRSAEGLAIEPPQQCSLASINY